MLSEVPEGWELRALSSLAQYVNGKAFKPSDWSIEGLPIIRIPQLKDPYSSYNCFSGGDVDDKYQVTKGDLLFSWSATLTAVIWEAYDAVLNQHIFKVEPFEDVEKGFLLYRLLLSIDELMKGAHGTTMQHIKKRELDTHLVALPPLPEQKRIAEILSSVDESIQATQSVIDQAERVKKGLMEDLLTGGLGSEAIARGEVPEGWSNSALMNVCKMYAGGTPNRKKVEFYQPAEVPWVKSGEVNQGVITKTEESISHEGLEKSAAKLVPKDTPLLAMYGATAGKVGWLSIEAATNQAILACEPMPNVASKYIYYLLQQISQKLIARQQGGAQPNLSKTLVSSYQIALPPLPEQKRIAEILSSVDDFIQNQRKIIEQYQVTKKGLMDDLLTGRVRTV